MNAKPLPSYCRVHGVRSDEHIGACEFAQVQP